MGIKAVVSGIGYHLPENVVTSEEVERRVYETTRFRLPRGLVRKVTGIESRHYCADGDQASDLAVEASRTALERAGIKPDQVDLLIFASCMQDVAEPATANIIQEKLGATEAHVFDVKNACNSFLNGLDVAESQIQTGKAKTVLIAAGETLSFVIDWAIDSVDKLRSAMAGLTLGDAGAAAVITAETNGNGRGFLPSTFRSYGDQWRLATVMSGGTMYRTSAEHSYFSSKSQELREQALKYIPIFVKQTLDRIGWKPDEIDVVCCHQVTMELVRELASRCGIPLERCAVSLPDCGNTAAASIPIGLARAQEEGRLKPYTKVLLVGGAAGFSVGVVPIVW